MARVKGALMTRKRRKKTLKLAKGYWGSKSKHFKMAKQAVMKSGNYAYVGRKARKRDFRRLWITRISAAWDEPTTEKCPRCGKTLLKKKGKHPKIYCITPDCGYEKTEEE